MSFTFSNRDILKQAFQNIEIKMLSIEDYTKKIHEYREVESVLLGNDVYERLDLLAKKYEQFDIEDILLEGGSWRVINHYGLNFINFGLDFMGFGLAST